VPLSGELGGLEGEGHIVDAESNVLGTGACHCGEIGVYSGTGPREFPRLMYASKDQSLGNLRAEEYIP